MNQLHSSQGANLTHLRRLFLLRNIFIVVQLLAYFVAEYFLDIHFNFSALWAIVNALALFNIYVWFRLNKTNPVTNDEIFRHLLFDVVALGCILYFTGGASNPFITLFIFPIIISVTVLPARYAWLLAGITLFAYTLLMFVNMPLSMGHASHGMDDEFNIHIVGMWLAFALSASLVAHFVFKMGDTIRVQEEQLQKARELALRDKQLIELGTLAASTAHELGTPLGTMNLLVSELSKELHAQPDQIHKDLFTLKQQIDRCKEALSNLSASAGAINISGGTLTPVMSYLQYVYSSWQAVRPGDSIATQWRGINEDASLLSDRMLTQAIMNILDNAVEVSPEDVEWDAMWNSTQLAMEIRDRGAGLSEDLIQKIGKQPVAQREQGMGLGLFLSHAIIERFGGSVSLFNREGGGIITRIVIPLVGGEQSK